MKSLESFAVRHADKLPLERMGNYIFDENCASCHDNPAMHAPTRQALSGYSLEGIIIAMEFGKMQSMAEHLSKTERKLIAVYLAGSSTGHYDWLKDSQCKQPPVDVVTEFSSNWGLGIENRRFVKDEIAGITKSNVGSLTLQWSLALPKVTDMRSHPAVIGDTLYFGDKAGKLYAINRTTGCIRAHTKVFSGIRSAITVAHLNNGKKLIIFADSVANVVAVDPVTLEKVWETSVRVFDTSIVTGSMSFHDDKLFVPISSYEVASSGSDKYECCHSHGGVMALDANSGDQQWLWHSTKDASSQGVNREGVEMFGPAGAVVWTTPAIDPQRNRIYFGTGENLSHPATDTSDAIIALDMDTGELAWRFQATKGDVWNTACLNDGANCPEDAGGDFDFGASVIIANMADGRPVLLAGQKNGGVYALNPDTRHPDGELYWKTNIGTGSTNGGIHWGMSLSGQTLVIPISDPERVREGYIPQPGLYALDISTGEYLWKKPVARSCEFNYENRPLTGLQQAKTGVNISLETQYECSFYYGLSAAAMTTSQLAFSGGLDGIIRAYDLDNGDILWKAKTAIPFEALNGVKGHGGSIDVSGQVLADGWLYVMSGYSMFSQLPGNMLLAYKVTK